VTVLIGEMIQSF